MNQRRLVVGGIVLDADQRVLAARRSRPERLAGRWEFPGGKVEHDESPRAALERELWEELGIRVQVHAEFDNVDPGQGGSGAGAWPIDEHFEMRVWFACLVGGEPVPGDSHDEVRWLERDHLLDVAWVAADLPIAERLAGR